MKFYATVLALWMIYILLTVVVVAQHDLSAHLTLPNQAAKAIKRPHPLRLWLPYASFSVRERRPGSRNELSRSRC